MIIEIKGELGFSESMREQRVITILAGVISAEAVIIICQLMKWWGCL